MMPLLLRRHIRGFTKHKHTSGCLSSDSGSKSCARLRATLCLHGLNHHRPSRSAHIILLFSMLVCLCVCLFTYLFVFMFTFTKRQSLEEVKGGCIYC